MMRAVGSYLRPYLPAFVFALAQVVFISALELLKPWPLKIILDHVLTGTPVPWEFAQSWSSQDILWLTCAGLVVVYLLLAGLHIINDYTTIRIGQKMVNDLRRDLYSQIQRLSLSFHHRRQVGDLLYRLTSDTYAIQTITMNGVFPVLCSLTLFVGMLLVMVRLDLTPHLFAPHSMPNFSGARHYLAAAWLGLSRPLPRCTSIRAVFSRWCSGLSRLSG